MLAKGSQFLAPKSLNIIYISAANSSDVEHELTGVLLANSSQLVRPVKHWSDVVNVTMDLIVIEVLDIVSMMLDLDVIV